MTQRLRKLKLLAVVDPNSLQTNGTILLIGINQRATLRNITASNLVSMIRNGSLLTLTLRILHMVNVSPKRPILIHVISPGNIRRVLRNQDVMDALYEISY